MAKDTDRMKKMDQVTGYFQNVQNDPALLERMSRDPIGVLRSMGITVDEKFKDAVTLQLRGIADFTKLQMEEETAKADKRPQEAMMADMAKSDDVPEEVKQAIEFSVQPWGLVLTVREPAVKYLQGGGGISAGVLGGIATLAGITGPLGIGIAIIAGICAAALGIYAGVITITDRGKGVYLTWTWAQFLPFLIPPIPNPMYGIPVVTAI